MTPAWHNIEETQWSPPGRKSTSQRLSCSQTQLPSKTAASQLANHKQENNSRRPNRDLPQESKFGFTLKIINVTHPVNRAKEGNRDVLFLIASGTTFAKIWRQLLALTERGWQGTRPGWGRASTTPTALEPVRGGSASTRPTPRPGSVVQEGLPPWQDTTGTGKRHEIGNKKVRLLLFRIAGMVYVENPEKSRKQLTREWRKPQTTRPTHKKNRIFYEKSKQFQYGYPGKKNRNGFNISEGNFREPKGMENYSKLRFLKINIIKTTVLPKLLCKLNTRLELRQAFLWPERFVKRTNSRARTTWIQRVPWSYHNKNRFMPRSAQWSYESQ